jgi:hypothetical protein
VKKEVRQQVKVTRLPTPQGRIGNTEEGQKSDDVLQGVDEGCTRDNPTKGSVDLASGASHVTVAIANLMSLVKDDTIPLNRMEEGGVVI